MERGGHETAATFPPLDPALNEAGPLQHPEMLRDGGQGHVVRLRQFQRGRLASRQSREDATARGIGQRSEQLVQGDWACCGLDHMLQ